MTEARGWAEKFEKIVRIIPGMKGYQDKNNFRESDKAVRVAVSKKLDEVRLYLDEVKRDMVENGKLMDVDLVDRSQRKIQKLADTVKYDSYGYSGYFDKVKIREPELEQLYTFDMQLFDDVDGLMGAAKQILEAADLKAQVKALDKRISDFEALLGKRRAFEGPPGA